MTGEMSTKKKRAPSTKTDDKTRARAPNFSDDDKQVLVQIMGNYIKILENKRTDGVSVEEKKNSWVAVTNEFNRRRGGVQRSVDNLQNAWKTLKAKTRNYRQAEKKEQVKTGGGSNDFEKNPLYESMLELIGWQIDPLDNAFDSDAKPSSMIENLFENDNCEDSEPAGCPTIFKFLQETGQIPDWKKWSIANLKKPVSNPLRDILNKVKVRSDKDPQSAGTSADIKSETSEIIDLDSEELEDIRQYDTKSEYDDSFMHEMDIKPLPDDWSFGKLSDKMSENTETSEKKEKEVVHDSKRRKTIDDSAEKSAATAPITCDLNQRDVSPSFPPKTETGNISTNSQEFSCSDSKVSLQEVPEETNDHTNLDFVPNEELMRLESLKVRIEKQKIKVQRLTLKNNLLNVKIEKKQLELQQLKSQYSNFRGKDILHDKENIKS